MAHDAASVRGARRTAGPDRARGSGALRGAPTHAAVDRVAFRPPACRRAFRRLARARTWSLCHCANRSRSSSRGEARRQILRLSETRNQLFNQLPFGTRSERFGRLYAPTAAPSPHVLSTLASTVIWWVPNYPKPQSARQNGRGETLTSEALSVKRLRTTAVGEVRRIDTRPTAGRRPVRVAPSGPQPSVQRQRQFSMRRTGPCRPSGVRRRTDWR